MRSFIFWKNPQNHMLVSPSPEDWHPLPQGMLDPPLPFIEKYINTSVTSQNILDLELRDIYLLIVL